MSKKLGKFQVETERFLPDSLCHYIDKDLEVLELTSPEIVREDVIIAPEVIEDVEVIPNKVEEGDVKEDIPIE